jgi:c-di-GMP-binding flagellar brake protein YcgR
LADNPLAPLRNALFGKTGDPSGQEIAIEILAGPWRGSYETLVTGADTERLFLTPPVLAGRPVRPEPGTPVRAELRNADGSCCFMGNVVSDELIFGHCLAITMPTEIRRLQRRSFVRQPVALPVQVMKLPAAGERPERAPAFLHGMTRDIGGGGLSFICSGLQALPGDLVSVLVLVPEAARRVQATCEVIRSDEAGGPIAVRFVDVDERAREELSGFVARACRRTRASTLHTRLQETKSQ